MVRFPRMSDQIATGKVVLGDDFTQHRIVGNVTHAYSRGLPPRLDVPLISHVEDGLWQGGCLNGVRLPDGFDHVLSLYPWERYVLGPDTTRTEVRMLDSLEQSTELVEDVATAAYTRLLAGQTVLVHCQAGLNRSGLVAARILTLLGYSGDEAIEKLRGRSPLVLCNETFENYIRSIPKE